MNEQAEGMQKSNVTIALKVEEREVSGDDPWQDDLLRRGEIAKRLTNMVAHQPVPLTICLNGGWGTGKTFLLKRWQKGLEKQGFKAIYFNAWEDDFCDDPLLSIIGQMWDYFEKGKGGKIKRIVESVKKDAASLVWANIKGVVNNKTGLILEIDQGDQTERNLIDEYLKQTRTRAELKKRLRKMATAVYEESGQPLVFIIDELDRCRPTFAIELLERVKHIFDVDNMVFVLGINRDELAKSLKSVYGEIDSEVYLRRFFDFDFELRQVDSSAFASSMIQRFQLVDAFQNLSKASGKAVHMHDYDNYIIVFPKLWSALRLSLRDIDYCVRLLAFLARNVNPGSFTHPFLLGLLVAMKFKNPKVYADLIGGDFETREIMDFLDRELTPDLIDEDLSRYLDRTEGFLYCADNSEDNANRKPNMLGEAALQEIVGLLSSSISDCRVLSRRAQSANPYDRERIAEAIVAGRTQLHVDSETFSRLAALIDIYQPMLMR